MHLWNQITVRSLSQFTTNPDMHTSLILSILSSANCHEIILLVIHLHLLHQSMLWGACGVKMSEATDGTAI